LKYTFTSVSGSVSPFVASYGSSISVNVNFGQKPFKFPPPAGFQPLALANTPRPTIVRPDQFMGVATYTGNGATSTAGTLARTVTGLSFKPDLIWVKERTATGTWADHNLTDSVRGTGLALRSNTTDTETNIATAFSQGGIGNGVNNGFTIISGTGGGTNNVNANNSNYVAWAWKAGGNSNTYNINDVGYATASAAGLTAGTITPTGASVNTKSGFSIITYTGTGNSETISHGLGKAPKFLIIKNRDDASSWPVWTTAIDGSFDQLYLELTDAKSDLSHSAPTSTVFTNLGGSGSGANTKRYVAYLWAEIPGFSKFGSYTGNGSSDGPMVITGFKPRWIMLKQSSASGENWRVFDTARSTYNPTDNRLLANLSNAESVGVPNELDTVSNGFKFRATDGASNGSGATYIYMAFAETPTQNLYGAQSNAR
jgi:hypothetical protein